MRGKKTLTMQVFPFLYSAVSLASCGNPFDILRLFLWHPAAIPLDSFRHACARARQEDAATGDRSCGIDRRRRRKGCRIWRQADALGWVWRRRLGWVWRALAIPLKRSFLCDYIKQEEGVAHDVSFPEMFRVVDESVKPFQPVPLPREGARAGV